MHCADLHLDRPFVGGELSHEKAKQRKKELLYTFERICAFAKEEAVDLLLIAGDLYEHAYIEESTVEVLLQRFQELYPIPVLLCGGNHDPVVEDWVHKELSALKNVTIFGEKDRVCFPELGVHVYGEGFTYYYKDAFDGTWLSDIDERAINILLTHASLDIQTGRHPYHFVRTEQLIQTGMDYCALGHFHTPIMKKVDETYIVYPGSPEPLAMDEVGEHGVILLEIEKIGKTCRQTVRQVPIQMREVHDCKVDVTGCLDIYQCMDRIKERMEGVLEKDMVMLTLEGFLEKGIVLSLNRIKPMLAHFFFAKIKDHTMENISIDTWSQDMGIRGEFVRIMLKLIDTSCDEEHRRRLLTALYIGMEALSKGRVDMDRYFHT